MMTTQKQVTHQTHHKRELLLYLVSISSLKISSLTFVLNTYKKKKASVSSYKNLLARYKRNHILLPFKTNYKDSGLGGPTFNQKVIRILGMYISDCIYCKRCFPACQASEAL